MCGHLNKNKERFQSRITSFLGIFSTNLKIPRLFINCNRDMNMTLINLSIILKRLSSIRGIIMFLRKESQKTSLTRFPMSKLQTLFMIMLTGLQLFRNSTDLFILFILLYVFTRIRGNLNSIFFREINFLNILLIINLSFIFM